MPATALKHLAKRAKVSQERAEHLWRRAKEIVQSEYDYTEDDAPFWALTMGITKKMMGLSEQVSFSEFLLIEKVKPSYLKGLNASEREEMKREIKRFSKMDHKDKDAYPDDWTADQKYKERLKKRGKSLPKSRHTEKFKQMYGEDLNESQVDTALKNKADKTGVPLSILRQVWNRGAAAWRTGHRPGVSQHQWAHGRVNSFLVGGPARKSDKDLWQKVVDYRKRQKSK